jgi:hypothetical protein
VSSIPLREQPIRRHPEIARAGPWLRARVFVGRVRLDRALARGADPAGSRELALRAEQLQRPKVRERIAKAIDRLTALSFDDPRRHIGPAMLPFRYQRVRPNLDGFAELTEALRTAGPHSVKGLAMASTLLEDGRGPLYASDPGETLQVALAATISEIKDRDG